MRQRTHIHTAMSGLSANTYSWGGDASLLGRGGDSILVAGAGLGALEKNLRIPSFLDNWRSSSSSDGTDERSEDSSPDMVGVCVGRCSFCEMDEVSRSSTCRR
jgi:hypothetical protein